MILLCPACTLQVQVQPAGSPDMQQAAPAPPWAAHAPKSLPVPRSSLGFACTPISKTPLGQPSPQMLQPPAPLGCGSSASGEKARMSKDAQTSPLAQMLHPGIRRVEMPQQVRRRQGCCPGCPSGALAHTHQQQWQGGYLRLTQQQQNLILGLRRWTMFSKLSSGLAA